MEIDLEELKRLARMATRGQWIASGHTVLLDHHCETMRSCGDIARCPDAPCSSFRGEENAAYIAAACNALPDLIERLERVETAWQHTADRQEIERLKAEIAALREQVRWIPVSERLPMERPDPMPTDEDEDNPFVPQVIACAVTIDGETYQGFFGLWPDEDGGVYFGWSDIEGYRFGGEPPITHWRPIGPLPEVKE